MCGIISFQTNLKTIPVGVEDIFAHMLWVDSIRGYDSTGMFFQETDGTVDHYKKPIPGWDFVQTREAKRVLSNLNDRKFVVGHNRAATRGAVSAQNAHPFEFGPVTGVHNGTLTDFTRLSNFETGLQVDSQHLYKGIEMEGSAAIIPELNGAFALFWADTEDHSLHFVRNDRRPYCFAKLKDKDIMLGASEQTMLEWLIERSPLDVIDWVWEPEPMVEYIWDASSGGNMIEQADEVKHKEYVPPRTTNAGTRSAAGYHGSTTAARSQNITFFLDSIVANKHVSNGVVRYTGYGENANGIEVVAYGLDKDQLKLDTWYTADCYFITNGTNKPYYTVINNTAKLHPAESEESQEVINICSHCGSDFSDDEVVWVDLAPVCIGCAQQLNVEASQLDDQTEAHKLLVH